MKKDALGNARGDSGFTIIELLVVVAIIGILSAIAIVNYVNALDKAKQRQTIADIREMAMAWERYHIDHNTYAVSAAYVFPDEPVAYVDLLAAMVPNYSKTLHQFDGWGNSYEFALDGDRYSIRSKGKDGVADDDYENPDPRDYDTDIVFSSGSFVVYPAE